MSEQKDVPVGSHSRTAEVSGSPRIQNRFLIPSPIPTRRTRTKSMSERAAEGPSFKGIVKEFCREKGHGFIHENDTKEEDIFVHISDIDGEWVPKAGDEVTFKKVQIPPKLEKLQAVHVMITHLKPGVHHERWDSPVTVSPKKIAE